jgi:hypothetical protein
MPAVRKFLIDGKQAGQAADGMPLCRMLRTGDHPL